MEEYKRLYELYQSKTDSELKEIINPENGYTPLAIKVASDILSFGRIGYEETVKQQNGIITLPEPDVKKTKEEKTPKYPSWLITMAVACCLTACITVISGIFDLVHIINLNGQTNPHIQEGIYEGNGDFYGLVFYFYGKNTFAFSTVSGKKISYGTYETDGNAITLGIASETHFGVSLDNGQKIMISDSQLSKTTDDESLKKYKKIFSGLDQE